jgi:hypothetical protein
MFKQYLLVLLVVCVAVVGLAPAANAGIKVYEDGDKYIEIGGRIQLQYLYVTEDPREGNSESEDTIWFRRLRPYIQGSVTKNWHGKIQFDFGKSLDNNEVAVKDAYMQYTGFKNHTVFIGSSKTVFSREFLTSSKRQQTVERWFVGQHNFGSPDRMLGFRVDGKASKKFEYKFNVGAENFDPDNRRMDFDNPANDTGDWTRGWVGAGRVTFYPLEPIKRDQGDFERGAFGYAIEAAAFSWTSNTNRLPYTEEDENGNKVCTSSSKCDLDDASGWELSGGIRGRGLSADLEYNEVKGTMFDRTVNSGMYVNGETTIKKWQLEGGYMLANTPIEFVAKWDSMDTDGYEKEWSAWDLGVNYFFNKHKAKVQFLYRNESNIAGDPDLNGNQFVMQWQFVF